MVPEDFPQIATPRGGDQAMQLETQDWVNSWCCGCLCGEQAALLLQSLDCGATTSDKEKVVGLKPGGQHRQKLRCPPPEVFGHIWESRRVTC
jgi:hypothetical protein